MSEMIGRTLNGRYRITERIGLGGMAEVFRAQDMVLGRMVAVKVMLPQFAADANFTQRFKQEAAAAANLQSPYIVNIYDWGQDNGAYYIVMEYVHGTDLKSAIQQRGTLNQRKVAEIGVQVCQALSVAHNNDIIHRDVKPQNIMIQPDGNVKVMDFGIARSKNSNMSHTESVLGTAHYISPEQAQGQPLTATSDIYSLGIVLYEAATGMLPFDGPDAVSVAVKQIQEQPIDPRAINAEISPALADIIMRALSKSPYDRFSTAGEMAAALTDYLQGRSFANARTQVIGAAGAGMAAGAAMGAAGARNASSTTVMPATMQGGQNKNNPKDRNGKDKDSNGSGKKRAAIGIVIGVIAVIAVVIIAMNIFGGEKTGQVPNVVGKTTDEATEVIQDSGFAVGSISQEYSDRVEEGVVISQDPTGGTKKAEKTKINLRVSKGSEKISVPDLSGMTASEARAALEKLGLKGTAGTAEYSDDVEKDKVMKQSPAAGTELSKGDSVTYILSLGEEKGEVPYVVGMDYTTAQNTIKAAGFNANTQWATHSESQGIVYGQDPSSGNASAGSTITIYVSSGPATTPVPTTTSDPTTSPEVSPTTPVETSDE